MEVEVRGQQKWEEHIYWSHFQTLHFFHQFSGDDFNRQLAIPGKFSDNLKLPGTVSLKAPSGNLWDVGVTTGAHGVYFKHGWKKFVEDNLLQENDVLVFKYKRDFGFDVLIFDGNTFCEKEASYFGKRCELPEADSGCKKDTSSPESVEVADESTDDDIEVSPPKKCQKMELFTSTPTPRSVVPVRPKTESKEQKNTKSVQSQSKIELSSNRRAVTEEEKEKVLEMASAAESKDSFMVLMRRSHVYTGFSLSIPCDWVRTHLPFKTLNLKLRLKEKTWPVKFIRRDEGGGKLVGGWKNFVFKNFLEEFDVCVFTLVSKPTEDMVLDVTIFRVVEEVTPPSVVGSVYSRGRKVTKYVRRRTNIITSA